MLFDRETKANRGLELSPRVFQNNRFSPVDCLLSERRMDFDKQFGNSASAPMELLVDSVVTNKLYSRRSPFDEGRMNNRRPYVQRNDNRMVYQNERPRYQNFQRDYRRGPRNNFRGPRRNNYNRNDRRRPVNEQDLDNALSKYFAKVE